MSIGLWDADLASIGQVPFNLELMKISAYYKKMHEIVAMSPRLEPDRYTNFFIRKDWDDGIYPLEFFAKNCSYGGRAFNENKYKPLDLEIEKIMPDPTIYESNFSKYDKEFYTTQSTGQHIRLSLDGKNIQLFDNFQLYPKVLSLNIHDYDIASLNNGYETIKELLNQNKGKSKRYLQTKYPINIYNVDELAQWCEFDFGRMTTLQIQGIMDNDMLEYIKTLPYSKYKTIIYNITYDWIDEEDFIQNKLPIIFHQSSILRKFNPKKLLIFDRNLFEHMELYVFLYILNDYTGPVGESKKHDIYIEQADSASFGLSKYIKIILNSKVKIPYTRDQARMAFQFIREHNYPLFKEFYECTWRDFL